eukprot:6260634-Prymnesium_polylepis.1
MQTEPSPGKKRRGAGVESPWIALHLPWSELASCCAFPVPTPCDHLGGRGHAPLEALVEEAHRLGERREVVDVGDDAAIVRREPPTELLLADRVLHVPKAARAVVAVLRPVRIGPRGLWHVACAGHDERASGRRPSACARSFGRSPRTGAPPPVNIRGSNRNGCRECTRGLPLESREHVGVTGDGHRRIICMEKAAQRARSVCAHHTWLHTTRSKRIPAKSKSIKSWRRKTMPRVRLQTSRCSAKLTGMLAVPSSSSFVL